MGEEDELYQEVNKRISNWPNWKKKFYNDNFVVRGFNAPLLIDKPVSEDVTSAIKFLEIADAMCQGDSLQVSMFKSTLKTILAALRAYHEPVPCQWCTDKHSYSLRFGLDGGSDKFCAECGRSLRSLT